LWKLKFLNIFQTSGNHEKSQREISLFIIKKRAFSKVLYHEYLI